MALSIDYDFMRALVYGSAVGDALGVPFEFRDGGTFLCDGMTGYGTHCMPIGTWSDDTSLTIALCESLLWNGDVDAADIMNNFRGWMNNGAFTSCGYVFDIGTTTAEAIKRGYGLKTEWSKGNGSLMRISPLAATDCTDEQIREVSALTHATDLCCDLCVSFVHMLRDVHDDPEHAKEIVSGHADVAGRERSEVMSGGYVVETYEAAAWCFLTTDSYEECVLSAVNLGHDTDTTACVAGALAAAAYGMGGIPVGMIGQLQAVEQIEMSLYEGVDK